MSAIVPRDIARRLERRWAARLRQDESFQAKAEKLKRNRLPCVEGTPPFDADAAGESTVSSLPILPQD